MNHTTDHYWEKLIVPSLSEMPKEQKVTSLWSKVQIAHVEQILRHITLTLLGHRSKRYNGLPQGEVLLADACGKLVEAFIIWGDDERV